MSRKTQDGTKTRNERMQAILRLIREHSIGRQEELQAYLLQEGFEVTQATISRDIRELCLVKASTEDGYRYVSSHNEGYDPKAQGRFETIFRESVHCSGQMLFRHGKRRLPGVRFPSVEKCGGDAVGRRYLSDRGSFGTRCKNHLHRACPSRRPEIRGRVFSCLKE